MPWTNFLCFYNCRKKEDNTYQGTTWQIKFELNNVAKGSTYKLRVAIASATLAELQVILSFTSSYTHFLGTACLVLVQILLLKFHAKPYTLSCEDPNEWSKCKTPLIYYWINRKRQLNCKTWNSWTLLAVQCECTRCSSCRWHKHYIFNTTKMHQPFSGVHVWLYSSGRPSLFLENNFKLMVCIHHPAILICHLLVNQCYIVLLFSLFSLLKCILAFILNSGTYTW